VTTKGYGVSLCADENALTSTMAMVALVYEYTKNCRKLLQYSKL